VSRYEPNLIPVDVSRMHPLLLLVIPLKFASTLICGVLLRLTVIYGDGRTKVGVGSTIDGVDR